jgi:hypothetical protein
MDISIPPLFNKIFLGNFIPTANIDFVSPVKGRDLIYFQMAFKDVFLTSLGLSGETGKDTTVAGSFAYDFIKMTYTEYGPEGNKIASATASYDLITHKGSAAELAELFALGMSGPGNNVPVPIPASLVLFGSGLAGLAGLRRKFSR